MITLRQAFDRTLTRLQMAAGVDVQIFSEEVLLEIIQHKVDALFDGYWWPQFFNPGETWFLDGVQGIVTEDLTNKIKRFGDIKHIWLGNNPDPLPIMNQRVNPAAQRVATFAPYALPDKVFRIYPNDIADSVTVSYRTQPDKIENEDDEIDFDDQLIILGSAYDYLNALGTNQGEEDKLLSQFTSRLDMLTKNIDKHDTATSSQTSGLYPTQWWANP